MMAKPIKNAENSQKAPQRARRFVKPSLAAYLFIVGNSLKKISYFRKPNHPPTFLWLNLS